MWGLARGALGQWSLWWLLSCSNGIGVLGRKPRPHHPISPQRAEDYGPVEVISHWHPNITINIVDDHTPWVKGSVPPPLDQCEPGPDPWP